jgi:hypothetical protein
MSIFSRILGLLKPAQTVNASQVMAQEKAYITQRFVNAFTEQPNIQAYIEQDYPKFLNQDYPEQVKIYDFIDPKQYPEKELPEYGLALSGGGIRSASFGIGVIQALRNRGFFGDKPTAFSKIKYLSSVAGGGYAGGSLTWYQKLFNLFPFDTIETTSASEHGTKYENKVLNYLRQHSQYLMPKSLGFKSLIASILMSVLHSTVSNVLLLALLFYLIQGLLSIELISSLIHSTDLHDQVKSWGMIPILRENSEPLSTIDIIFSTFFFMCAILSVLFFVLITFGYALSSIFSQLFSLAHGYRITVQRLLGRLYYGFGSCLVLGVLPLIAHHLFGSDISLVNDAGSSATVSSTGLLAVFLSLKKMRDSNRAAVKSGLFDNILSMMIIPIFIVFVAVVSYIVAELIHQNFHWAHSLMIMVVFLALIQLVNINHISPHKMYHDRLMETFFKQPQVEAAASLEQRGRLANDTKLSQLALAPYWSAYHLVNCNIILNKATNSCYRSRLGDSFILSPLYCGSSATQYQGTDEFANGSMTLATAVTISGAAANPRSAISGLDKSNSPLVSFLMTFFGLRLSYWSINPSHKLSKLGAWLKPNYLLPGLSSLLNRAHNEKDLFIELSDGGHFDNTGVYELVRRRVPVIILADGGADEHETFDNVGNMMQKIRVDFGVSVSFSHKSLDLTGILSGSASNKNDPNFVKKLNQAQRGYAIADILYPDIQGKPAFVGKLVVIKPTVTDDLTIDLYSYKAVNPSYPDQSTADQSFDERQFESYRELGYQLTKQLVKDKDAMALLP